MVRAECCFFATLFLFKVNHVREHHPAFGVTTGIPRVLEMTAPLLEVLNSSSQVRSFVRTTVPSPRSLHAAPPALKVSNRDRLFNLN